MLCGPCRDGKRQRSTDTLRLQAVATVKTVKQFATIDAAVTVACLCRHRRDTRARALLTCSLIVVTYSALRYQSNRCMASSTIILPQLLKCDPVIGVLSPIKPLIVRLMPAVRCLHSPHTDSLSTTASTVASTSELPHRSNPHDLHFLTLDFCGVAR